MSVTSVLVIDDEAEIRNVIGEVLQRSGYQVDMASNGVEGWQRISQYIPDVILCDVKMPKMNGFELLEHLRGQTSTETVPFIFLTSMDERAHVRNGMAAGADDYITKPFVADDVLMAVDACLQKREKIERRYDSTIRLLRKNITYSLPHELRTPLMSIMGYAELMMMDRQTMSREEFHMMSSIIFENSQRLHRLIENCLVYAQIEIMSSDPVKREALRNHIIPNAGEIIEKRADAIAEKWGREADLKLEMTNSALQISEENLIHIMNELIDNAFKFSEAGTPVLIKTVRKPGVFIIVVRDKGRGMTAEQLNNMGAYMQFERAVYEQQGMGLGLTIAQRLVDLHRGEFLVKSMPGQGTAILMQFPI